jgi:hypothetical protein
MSGREGQESDPVRNTSVHTHSASTYLERSVQLSKGLGCSTLVGVRNPHSYEEVFLNHSELVFDVVALYEQLIEFVVTEDVLETLLQRGHCRAVVLCGLCPLSLCALFLLSGFTSSKNHKMNFISAPSMLNVDVNS